MKSVDEAAEGLRVAIQNAETSATGKACSVPELRLAAMRLALAASEYQGAVMQRDVDRIKAARGEARPSVLSLITPKAWKLWRP